VKLRKFLAVFVLVFVFALPIFAKYMYDFEEPWPDTLTTIAPWIPYRDLDTSCVSVVENVKWFSSFGHHAVEIRLNKVGKMWLVFLVAKWQAGYNARDTLFLKDLAPGDTIYYYWYIPCGAPIDSFFIFERDSMWGRDYYSYYFPEDLTFGAWNELKDGISEMRNNGSEPMLFPLIQIDCEFHTDSMLKHNGVAPNCTLYFDCPSSMGPVSAYADTAGQRENCAGVEMPKQGSGAVSVPKTSINCLEYETKVMAPVAIQVFNAAGRKQLEIVPGVQPAGKYSIPLELPAGVYLVRVVAGKEVETGKIISVIK
jgi:hypothetical protein